MRFKVMGKLPESIPDTERTTFDHFTEARDSLAERLSTFSDEEHASGGPSGEARAEDFNSACAEVMGWKTAPRVGDSVGVFAGGYVFSILTDED